MLTKLIKYEFNAVSKVLLAVNLITVGISLIGCLTFVSPLWEFESGYTFFLATVSLMVYYIAIIAISLSSMIYMAVRFYRNLYTDEGYLMHTLPVKPYELILSKGITAFIWTLITIFMIFFSVCILIFTAFLKFGWNELPEFQEVLRGLPEMCHDVYGMTVSGTCIFFMFALVIGSLCSIFMFYAAISVGQLFKSHKVLAGVGCYFGFYFLMQICSSIGMMPFYLFNYNGSYYSGYMGDYMQTSLLITLILSTIFTVVFYIITEQIMRKKLNLE